MITDNVNCLNLFSLNVRGIRDLRKRGLLFQFLARQNADVTFLQETFLTEELRNQVDREWGGTIFHSWGSNRSRGVAILLKKNTHFQSTVMHSSNDGRIIIVKIDTGERTFLLSNIYAPTEKCLKDAFFKRLLRCLRKVDNLESCILIIGGDFNCINHAPLDTIGNKSIYKKPREYKALIRKYSMIDIWRKMHKEARQFTYRNKHLKMASRIDFWLIPSSFTEFVQRTCIKPVSMCPDHCGITMSLTISGVSRGPSYWKMNNSLLKNVEYKIGIREVIEKVKKEHRFETNAQYLWDICKVRVREFTIMFSKKQKSNERKIVTNLEKKLSELHDQVNNENVNKEEEIFRVQQELNKHYKHLCDGARIRARVQQFEEGEKCSKYFLGLEKKNCVKQSISSLRIGGKIVHERERVQNFVKKSFSTLYKSSVCDEEVTNSYMAGIECPSLSDEDADICEGLLTIAEATEAIRHMKVNKSPGVDGLGVEFYKEFWPEVQDLVLQSLNAAFSKGQLSYTQRKGIISLLFKGGDKEELDNWRPLTLLNTDYKILAMVLTKRIQKVLYKIINEDQVGYLKGRSGTSIARLIQDVIDYYSRKCIDGIIIFADFRKAFDNLEWNFIDKCLQLYGFKESFRHWVSVLYSNPCLSVLVNGWLTENFTPTRGVRQGCPLSALLFILCIEVLSNKLRQDNDIKGLKIGFQSVEIKLAQLADDMTLFVKDVISGENAVKAIEEFSKVSGITLNKNKTKAMWLGEIRPLETISDINWCETFVKSLGIYFSNNNDISKEMNWSHERFIKIKHILDSWKQRNLTYRGKILILKTLVISKLAYTAQIVPCPYDCLNAYDKLFQKFLWGSKAKVKKENMINPIQDGGLGMTDIHTQFMSFYLKWLFTFLSRKESEVKTGKWNILFAYWIEEIGGIDIIMHCNCSPKFLTRIKSKLPDFYYELFYTWLTVKQATNSEKKQLSYKGVLGEMLWLNKDITYKGSVLLYKNWIRSNILFIGDVVSTNGFLNNNEIKAKLVYRDGRWLSEYARLRLAINAQWTRCIKEYRQTQKRSDDVYERTPLSYSLVQVVENKVAVDCVRVKQIYTELIKLKQKTSRAITFWSTTLQPDPSMKWKFLWLYKLKYVRDNSLIQFNFKFMYNILPTPDNLFKWKLKETNICNYCDQKGDVIHVFFMCHSVNSFWKTLEMLIRNNFCNDFVFTPLCAVYNFGTKVDNIEDIKLIINYALLSIYKVTVVHTANSRFIENHIKRYLAALLANRLEIEINRNQSASIDIDFWKRICEMI